MQRRFDSHRNGQARTGITLLEVLLSTAIFLGAVTAIMQIMRVGHDSRVSAKLDANAALRCESVMGQLVAGILPLTTVSEQSFDEEDSERWVYSVEIGDGGAADLLLVTVQVNHVIADQLPNSSFTLVRLLRDPQLFQDAALASMEAEEE